MASAALHSSYQRPVSEPIAVDAHVDGSPPSQPGGTFAVVLAWNGTRNWARVWPLSACEAIEMVVSVPVITISSVAGGELSTPCQCAVAGLTVHSAAREIVYPYQGDAKVFSNDGSAPTAAGSSAIVARKASKVGRSTLPSMLKL